MITARDQILIEKHAAKIELPEAREAFVAFAQKFLEMPKSDQYRIAAAYGFRVQQPSQDEREPSR